MQRRALILGLLVGLVVGMTACGASDDQSAQFPDFEEVDLAVNAMDWVVDGMHCEAEAVTRLVSSVEADDGESSLRVELARGDQCVERGQAFWRTLPSEVGDEVHIAINSDPEEYRSFRLESASSTQMTLTDDDGDQSVVMQRVYAPRNPSPIPGLDDVDLAGQWWMEGYPCHEELVPQLVRIIHPPGAVHMSKVVGDRCIGDGENFFDGELVESSISGEAWLEEAPEFGQGNPDEAPVVEAGGSVRNEDFIRLDIQGQAVTLWRVLEGHSN